MVLGQIRDIGIVGRNPDIGFIIEDREVPDLRIAGPDSSVCDMSGKRTDMVFAENPHGFDSGVGEIGKGEIHEGITAKERIGGDGPMFAHRSKVGAGVVVYET